MCFNVIKDSKCKTYSPVISMVQLIRETLTIDRQNFPSPKLIGRRKAPSDGQRMMATKRKK